MRSRNQIADACLTDPDSLTKEEIYRLYRGMPLAAQGVWENILKQRASACTTSKASK